MARKARRKGRKVSYQQSVYSDINRRFPMTPVKHYLRRTREQPLNISEIGRYESFTFYPNEGRTDES